MAAVIEAIRPDELYTLAEIKKRLGLGDDWRREAERSGMKTIKLGNKKFVLGSDVIEYGKSIASGGEK